MDTIKDNFKEIFNTILRSKKNKIGLGVVLILLIALPVGIYLSQQTQIFKPRAADVPGSFSIEANNATGRLVAHAGDVIRIYASAEVPDGTITSINIESIEVNEQDIPLPTAGYASVGSIDCLAGGTRCSGFVTDPEQIVDTDEGRQWKYIMKVFYIPPEPTQPPAEPTQPPAPTEEPTPTPSGPQCPSDATECFSGYTNDCFENAANAYCAFINRDDNSTCIQRTSDPGYANANWDGCTRSAPTPTPLDQCSKANLTCQGNAECNDGSSACQNYGCEFSTSGDYGVCIPGGGQSNPPSPQNCFLGRTYCSGLDTCLWNFESCPTCNYQRIACTSPCGSATYARVDDRCPAPLTVIRQDSYCDSWFNNNACPIPTPSPTEEDVLGAHTAPIQYCSGDDPSRTCGGGSIIVSVPREGGVTETPTPPAGSQCVASCTYSTGEGDDRQCFSGNCLDRTESCSGQFNVNCGYVEDCQDRGSGTSTSCPVGPLPTLTPTPPAGGTGNPPTAIVVVAAGAHGSTVGSYIGLNMKFQGTAFGQDLTKVEVMIFNGTSSRSLGSQNCTGNTTGQCEVTTDWWPIEGGAHQVYVVAESSGGRCAGGQGPRGDSFEGSSVPRCHPREPLGPSDTDDNLAFSGATTLVPATYNVVRDASTTGNALCVPVARPCTVEALNSATGFNQNVCDRAAFRDKGECERSAYFRFSNVPMYCCENTCRLESNQWDGRACWLNTVGNYNQSVDEYVSNPACGPRACNPGGGSFAGGGVGTSSITYQCQRDGTWRPTNLCISGDQRDPLTHCLVSGGPISQYWIDYCRQLALGPTPSVRVTTYGCLGSTCVQGVAGGYPDSTCGGTRCSTTPTPTTRVTPTPTTRVTPTPTPTTPPGAGPVSVRLSVSSISDADCRYNLDNPIAGGPLNVETIRLDDTSRVTRSGNTFTINNWDLTGLRAGTAPGSRWVCAQFSPTEGGGGNLGGPVSALINYLPTTTPTPTPTPTVTPTRTPTPTTVACIQSLRGIARNPDGTIPARNPPNPTLVDFNIWFREKNGLATTKRADFNCNGTIDAEFDLQCWRDIYTGARQQCSF